MSNHYEILGVSTEADATTIEKAYNNKKSNTHPANEKYKAIEEAHEILIDPQKREKYDLQMLISVGIKTYYGYIGQYNNAGKKHGKGKMTYPNGDVYEGGWRDGLRHDQGKMIYDNGGVYEKLGNIYDGGWKDGLRHGRGTMRYSNGDVFEGEYKNDEKDGRGKQRYTSGVVFEGEYKDGKKNGEGELNCMGGKIRIYGNWEKDKIWQGNMTYKNGDVYEGGIMVKKILPFVFRHGKGKMKYKNGDVYEGEWYIDEEKGNGKMTYKNNDVYEGSFLIKESNRPVPNGLGKMKYENGDVYNGNWEGGLRHGPGTFTQKNKGCCKSEWIHGKNVNEMCVTCSFWGLGSVGWGGKRKSKRSKKSKTKRKRTRSKRS